MYASILAPIDVSVPLIAEQILKKALFHLQYSDCQVTLLAVAPNGADENTLDEIRGQLMEFAEHHISTHEGRIQLMVEMGLPSNTILDKADEIHANLILMGSHRGGTNQLGRSTLGSTAAKIASQATCDVSIIKAM